MAGLHLGNICPAEPLYAAINYIRWGIGRYDWSGELNTGNANKEDFCEAADETAVECQSAGSTAIEVEWFAHIHRKNTGRAKEIGRRKSVESECCEHLVTPHRCQGAELQKRSDRRQRGRTAL